MISIMQISSITCAGMLENEILGSGHLIHVDSKTFETFESESEEFRKEGNVAVHKCVCVCQVTDLNQRYVR